MDLKTMRLKLLSGLSKDEARSQCTNYHNVWNMETRVFFSLLTFLYSLLTPPF